MREDFCELYKSYESVFTDFTIPEDQLSCCPGCNCAVKPRLRYHSASTSNTTLRLCCPGSNYAVKVMHPPTSLHA